MQAADILRSSHLGLIQTNKAIIDKHFHIQNLTTNKYKTQSFKYKENLVKCEMKFKSFFICLKVEKKGACIIQM